MNIQENLKKPDVVKVLELEGMILDNEAIKYSYDKIMNALNYRYHSILIGALMLAFDMGVEFAHEKEQEAVKEGNDIKTDQEPKAEA